MTNITLTTPKEENDWVCIDGRFGYIMPKMEGSLLDQIKKYTITLDLIEKAKNKVTMLSSKCIHGDIKLDNILILNNKSYLHDFDGVFVFGNTQKPVEIYFTPIYAHPLLPFVIDFLSSESDSITIQTENVKNVWNLHMSVALNMSSDQDVLKQYISQIQVYAFEQLHSETITLDTDFIKSLKFDLYSLGASLLHASIKMAEAEAQTDVSNKIQGKANEIFAQMVCGKKRGGAKTIQGLKQVPKTPGILGDARKDNLAGLYEKVKESEPLTKKEINWESFTKDSNFKVRYVGKVIKSQGQ